MNGMFWDQVVCDAEPSMAEKQQWGDKAKRCDGILMPITRKPDPDRACQYVESFWKCSRCGREVK